MFNNKFKEVRKVLGLTQREFSKFLGVSVKTVHRIENQSIPHINTQISKKLYDIGINPYYVNYDESLFRTNFDYTAIYKQLHNYE